MRFDSDLLYHHRPAPVAPVPPPPDPAWLALAALAEQPVCPSFVLALHRGHRDVGADFSTDLAAVAISGLLKSKLPPTFFGKNYPVAFSAALEVFAESAGTSVDILTFRRLAYRRMSLRVNLMLAGSGARK